jgi:transcriptional regulator with PAS, ATPase and Fis domain
MRLGSGAVVPLRARVLFATNRNLRQMVTEGTFREDLYYRVNVLGIHSRPLRERREDIPQLAQHFLATYARSYGRTVTNITPDALALLSEYAWPGNVRELENVMQSAILLCDGDSIRASNLPEDLQQGGSPVRPDDAGWNSFEDQLRDYKVRLANEA